MTDFGLEPLPYAIVRSNRMRNSPVWTQRYRPSFVSRTASEQRRKALVDYLAIAAGTKINDSNFPAAVKHEREVRSIVKQQRGRNSSVFREQTESSLQMIQSTSPVNSAHSTIFLTQLGLEVPRKPSAYAKESLHHSAMTPTPNLIAASSSSTPLFGNMPHTSQTPVTPTPTVVNSEPSGPSSSPNKESYFSQWRKEFWGTEASKRGKIMYFQVTRSAPLTSRPGLMSAPLSSKEPATRRVPTPKETPIQTVSSNSAIDSVHETPKEDLPKEKNPKPEKEPQKRDVAWSEAYNSPVEVVYETGDGSFPLSYVDLRPVLTPKNPETETSEEIGENLKEEEVEEEEEKGEETPNESEPLETEATRDEEEKQQPESQDGDGVQQDVEVTATTTDPPTIDVSDELETKLTIESAETELEPQEVKSSEVEEPCESKEQTEEEAPVEESNSDDKL